jgi:hypothetical protein
MATPEELSEWYAKLVKNANGFHIIATDVSQGPNLGNNINNFTINPPETPNKKVNLSACIESGVDMEFAIDNSDWSFIAPLKKDAAFKLTPYVPTIHLKGENRYFKYCRVRQDHWHTHQGSNKCPIPNGLIIIIQFIGNSGIIETTEQVTDYFYNGDHSIAWKHVTAFRVIGPTKGWKY